MTNMKTYLYYVNVCKYEYEKNFTRLGFKIMPKIEFEHTKGTEGSYSYLYPFGDLTQRNFQGGSMCASSKETS
jgi:hypothetical protein